MSEKLLLKCDTSIYADEIVSLLFANDIIARQHDESMDTVVGAYGAVTGIAIYVLAHEYDRAWALVSPVVEARTHGLTMCPKCGSEEVERIPTTTTRGTWLAMFALLLIFISGVYLVYRIPLGFYLPLTDSLAVLLVVVALVLLYIGSHSNDNCRCKHCGHHFHHL